MLLITSSNNNLAALSLLYQYLEANLLSVIVVISELFSLFHVRIGRNIIKSALAIVILSSAVYRPVCYSVYKT